MQYAVCSRQSRNRKRHAAPSRAPRISLPTAHCLLPTGFTLVEMLIVMAIIVLAITLAVPAIRLLTGSRSEQAAQNDIAAFVASARANAIGLQEPRGVLFYIDKTTDRVTLAQVMQSSFQAGPPSDPTAGVTAGIVYLDLAPNVDPLPLPPGVRVWTLMDQFAPSTAVSNPFPNYRYLGFDDVTYTPAPAPMMDKAKFGGVILFDAQGRLLVTQYGFRFTDHINGTATASALQGLAFINTSTTATNWGAAAASQYLRSQIGFVMFDRETFNQVQAGQTNLDGNNSATEPVVDPWIDTNATPILINRSNGTLTRAE